VQPTVIIPTFWTRRRSRAATTRSKAVYDHPTPIDEDGTLPECLRSLEPVEGLGRVLVVVAADDVSIQHVAEDRVHELLAEHPGIDSVVFGSAEMGSLHRRMEQFEFADLIGGVSLDGYGRVRNVALMAAAVLGSEVIVFVDDDQVVNSGAFLSVGMEGMGESAPSGRPVLAKTGYYVDERGGCSVSGPARWCDAFWRQDEAFDRAVRQLVAPPRLKPGPLAFGGCMALHRDMYCNVPFDPWVGRGEDIDYVINVRMHGGDMFTDADWSITHCPPPVTSEAVRFRQDVFRFVYAHRKIEFSKSQVDLRQVTAESLMPYPGMFVDSSVGHRARMTAALRAVAGPERGAYARIARTVVGEAQSYAREHCELYFAFQRRWPMLMDRLWEDIALKPILTGERRVDRGAITGRFPVISDDRAR
jgi:hypothetical protein